MGSGADVPEPVTIFAGTLIVGYGDIIEDADDAACALLGYRKDQLIGLHGSELVPDERMSATAASIDRMRRGELAKRTGALRLQDGSVVGVEVRARVLPDGRLALLLRRRRAA